MQPTARSPQKAHRSAVYIVIVLPSPTIPATKLAMLNTFSPRDKVQQKPQLLPSCMTSYVDTHILLFTMFGCLLGPYRTECILFIVQSDYLLYRQQRAALCIQRNWRRYQARKAFLLYRRRVVRLQCAWRSKMARKELRKRRASQREAGKLLQVCLGLHSCLFLQSGEMASLLFPVSAP